MRRYERGTDASRNLRQRKSHLPYSRQQSLAEEVITNWLRASAKRLLSLPRRGTEGKSEVEQIRSVEYVLIENGHAKTAKAYICTVKT